jgi:HPt (histidine-containing phosphotransfer) domain-containing protein
LLCYTQQLSFVFCVLIKTAIAKLNDRKSLIYMNQKLSPIDIEQLNQISEGDVEFEVEVLQVYIEDILQRIEIIREAIATSDISQLMKEAHHIKGSSSNVGALQMRNLAVQLEGVNLQQDRDKALEILEALLAAMQDVELFVNEKLATLAS